MLKTLRRGWRFQTHSRWARQHAQLNIYLKNKKMPRQVEICEANLLWRAIYLSLARYIFICFLIYAAIDSCHWKQIRNAAEAGDTYCRRILAKPLMELPSYMISVSTQKSSFKIPKVSLKEKSHCIQRWWDALDWQLSSIYSQSKKSTNCAAQTLQVIEIKRKDQKKESGWRRGAWHRMPSRCPESDATSGVTLATR